MTANTKDSGTVTFAIANSIIDSITDSFSKSYVNQSLMQWYLHE